MGCKSSVGCSAAEVPLAPLSYRPAMFTDMDHIISSKLMMLIQSVNIAVRYDSVACVGSMCVYRHDRHMLPNTC